MEKLKLKSINLKGYKSLDSKGQKIPFHDITVLIGPNGSGKSNLISFFKLLNYLTTGALQKYIGQEGSANSLLYFGAKKTKRIEAELTFSDNNSEDKYSFSLAHAAGDILIFTEELLSWKEKNRSKPFQISLDPGLKESGLYEYQKDKKAKTARVIFNLLKSCQVFQFHDTTIEAKIRNSGYIQDNKFLRSDGGNLAAFLYVLKKNHENYYQRIRKYIQKAMPQFEDFYLTPSAQNDNYIILNWYEKDSDYLFGPHQISDGSLRFMALATLLLQPAQTLPSVIILDEPELGLHPYAISLLAGMIQVAAKNSQIILATQSTRLIDEFSPENIIITERDNKNNRTIFKQLDENKLTDWLARYSISELWEKNVLGGRP